MKIINHFLDIIHLKDIPEEGLNLVFDEKKVIEDVELVSNIKGETFFEKVREDIILKGEFVTDIHLNCDRCLEDFAFHIDDNFFYTLLHREKKDENEETEPDILYFDGNNINFLDIIHEQIILQIPLKTVCKEDCKGICPGCGKNLNIEECSCDKKDDNIFFEKLINLKK
jgi:uncharacterized protein